MEFLPFFLVLFVGVLFSVAFRRFHLPWVLALITAGVVVGPHVLDVVEVNDTVAFIGQIGLIFLMFMAGLETRPASLRGAGKGIFSIALLNALIPFAVGYGIGYLFAFGLVPSLLLGIIFMSSSIAVIIPSLEATGIIHTKLGRTIVSATVIQDIASLVLLSILLQTIDPITTLSLPAFYTILAVILVAFRYGLPQIRKVFPQKRNEKDLFESEVRIIFLMLLGTVIVFELLGLHPIIAGFFAGLVLSSSITSDLLMEKLRTISFGIFIPVFFVIVGIETDITVFAESSAALWLVLAVLFGSLIAKLGSGWLGARLGGFRNSDALTVGIASIPQLSTTLAVAFTAVELGLLQGDLVTAMVVLSVVTTLVAPIALRALHGSVPRAQQTS